MGPVAMNSRETYISGTPGRGDGKGWLGAETKVVLLLCLSVVVLLVDTLTTLAVLYLLVLAIFLAARPGWRKFLIWLLFSAATLWGFLLTQSLFYPRHPRTVLLEIVSPATPILGPLTGGVALYWEGALYGAFQSLRFLILITAGLTVVWTTSPHRLLRGLRRLRLPHRAAFMVSTALRFLPAITAEARAVLAAMRVRGFPLQPSRPWSYLRALAAGLTPILVRNLRRSTMLADSVECKGFGRTEKLASLRKPDRRLAERVILYACPAAMLLLAIAKLLDYAVQNGIYYSESLGWLYELVEAAF